MSEKNAAAQALGRLGGLAKSEKKTARSRENARRYWENVRAGKAAPPNHKKKA